MRDDFPSKVDRVEFFGACLVMLAFLALAILA